MKQFFLFIAAFVMFASQVEIANAQGSSGGNTDLSFGADMVSRYVWRGTQFSTAPSIQPGVELGIGNLAIGAWGSYSYLGINDGAEADIYLSYTALNDMLTVTFTDYFFPDDQIASENNYFEYDEEKTGHIFEGSLSFNGTDNLPLSLLVGVNFWGSDAKKINDDENSQDFNQKEGNQMSTYIELGYSTKINETSLDLFSGFTPNKPKEADPGTGYIGESGFYGNTMGFVNIGCTASKEVAITEKFALPVSASLITNPMSENIFIVFSFSL